MAGHSHWARIRHKKQAQDAKKGKLFSKFSRMIMVAVKDGGPDPSKNIKLSDAIQRAREINMPKDTIENIIKRASGQTGAKLEEVLYEGYGPGGVAIMVEALTDNRNRTSNEIRKLFERHGGNLGSVNCVVWQFEAKGFIVIDANNLNEEEVLNDAIEAGADNVDFTGDEFEITCEVANFSNLKEVISSKYNVKSSEITKIPKTYINVDETTGRKVLVLVEALQDHDDVQNVYSNFMLPPSLAEEMQKR